MLVVFGHVHHEEVAVVVVADVIAPKAWDAGSAAIFMGGVAIVPVGDEVHAVGVIEDGEQDVVLEKAHRLGIGLGVHFIDGLKICCEPDGLGGVQASVDPDDGLAFGGERMGLLVGEHLVFGREVARGGELVGDITVVVELLEILGRGDNSHPLAAALGGLAHLHQLHAVGFTGELLPVLLQLHIVCEVVVVANVEPESFLGSGDFRSDRRGLLRSGQRRNQEKRGRRDNQVLKHALEHGRWDPQLGCVG